MRCGLLTGLKQHATVVTPEPGRAVLLDATDHENHTDSTGKPVTAAKR